MVPCVEFPADFFFFFKLCALAMVLNSGGPHLGQPQADLKNAGSNSELKATMYTYFFEGQRYYRL